MKPGIKRFFDRFGDVVIGCIPLAVFFVLAILAIIGVARLRNIGTVF